MKFPQAPLSFTLPPSRNSVLTCHDLLDRKAGEERRKKKIVGLGGIKTWSNLCTLSAFCSWHGGVVLHVYYNLPNNTADNYYNLYF